MTTDTGVQNEAQISFDFLSPAGVLEEFELHEAALQWSLADPIIIESAEDVKSRLNWQDRLEPYHHQMQNLMTFCRRLPVTLIADDVGLGKTISAGLVLSELMTRRRVSRTLVVCPSILGPQWIEELESKFGIFGRWATGGDLNKELHSQSPVVATTYHSISPRLSRIEPGMFDMLIMDEAHKIRNLYGTPNPPQIAKRIHRALDQRLFKYVLMLTATPIQNRLWDLYTLVDCLAVAKGHANPFGSAEQFKTRFIADPSRGARNLKPGQAGEFRKILRQYLVRTRRADVRLLFPERKVRLFRVKPQTMDVQLQQLVADNIQGLSGLLQSSLAVAMMSSPHALLAQLRNMAQKNPRWDVLAREVESLIANSPAPSKIQMLLQIIDELRQQRAEDWRLVIFTIRKETQRIIGDALRSRGIPYGEIKGGAAGRNTATVKAYTANPPQIHVIVSTDAGAEGVNLQAGNVLINFDLPWNPMVVEQRIGRIQRLAANHQHVFVFNLAVEGSPEEFVVARLMQKLQTISETVGDIEAILEASSDDADVSSASFEANIRELVVKSLSGQDVEQAAALATKSIQDAKELFESQQLEIDASLGNLTELHDSGPRMPRLKPVEPSIGYRDFVRRALEADGHRLSDSGDGLMRASKPGSPPEMIAFDEETWRQHSSPGAFMGRAPKLYLPGKPAFERLVQHWLDRGGHFVADTRPSTEAGAEQIARQWLKNINGSDVVSLSLDERLSNFQGRSCCKVTASNSLDSYEKIVEVEHVPSGHLRIFSNAANNGSHLVTEPINPAQLSPVILSASKEAIATDDDVNAFCKFYSARLQEELGKAGGRSDKRQKVNDDLCPAVHGQAVSLSGMKYEICRMTLNFTIDGHAGYSAELEACPATGQLLRQPETWKPCGATECRVPVECLEACQISGKEVLRHLLVESDVTGRRALKEHTRVCDVTGRVALEDEYDVSDLSGKTAIATLFQTSPVSDRKGLPEEFVQCEFTNSCVLADEISASEVSGKRYRSDQREMSAISETSGHKSEFVTCECSGDSMLPDESSRSDCSQRVVRSDLLERSERPPHRYGAPDELVTCENSGVRLLNDEVATCAVTGKVVDNELLEASDESGRRALPDTLVNCEITGRRLLPDETVQSAVSGRTIAKSESYSSPVSGRHAYRDECERCEVTGASVLPDELAESDVSRRRFRRDETVVSALSGRKGHTSEGAECQYSGQQLLLDEMGVSDYSKKRTAASELHESAKTGRKGTKSEMVVCAETRIVLLRDEVGKSDVSGQTVDEDLLVPSELSGKRGMMPEMVRCQVSGRLLLPSETATCSATGQLVERSLLLRSQMSGAWALADQMARCAVTGQVALRQELTQCELTGDIISPSSAAVCAATGKTVRRDKLVSSAVSGRLLIPSAGRKSIVDKRIMCPDEAVYCYWNEGYLLPDQAATCQRTELTFARNLIAPNGEFIVLRQLMRGQVQRFDSADLISWLKKQANGKLKSLKRAWCIESPRKGIRCVCGELHEMFGIRIRYTAIMVSVSGGPQLLGRITCTTMEGKDWSEL